MGFGLQFLFLFVLKAKQGLDVEGLGGFGAGPLRGHAGGQVERRGRGVSRPLHGPPQVVLQLGLLCRRGVPNHIEKDL